MELIVSKTDFVSWSTVTGQPEHLYSLVLLLKIFDFEKSGELAMKLVILSDFQNLQEVS